MPVTLPFNKFSTTSPNNVIYNFTDIVDGQGYSTFYATVGVNYVGSANASDYYLSTQIQQTRKVTGVEYYKLEIGSATAEFDFDTSGFSISRKVGTGYVLFECYYEQSNRNVRFNVQLFHYDGTTETAISDQLSCSASGEIDTANRWETFRLPISNSVNVAVGDQLRLKITGVENDTGNYVNLDNPTYPAKLQVPMEVQ